MFVLVHGVQVLEESALHTSLPARLPVADYCMRPFYLYACRSFDSDVCLHVHCMLGDGWLAAVQTLLQAFAATTCILRPRCGALLRARPGAAQVGLGRVGGGWGVLVGHVGVWGVLYGLATLGRSVEA